MAHSDATDETGTDDVSTELVAPSHGDDASVPVQLVGQDEEDEDLIDEVVIKAKELYVHKVLDFHRELGQLLLDSFYGGSIAAFKARGRSHASCRRVAELLHDEVGLSASSVWYSIALIEQFELLDEEVASALPMSHHRLLLTVKDEAKRRRLAQQANEKGWSKRELERRVRRKRKSDGRGRPPLPRFQKSLNAIRKLLQDDSDGFGELDQIEKIKPQDVKQLHETAISLKMKAEEIQRALERHLPGFSDADEE